MIIASLLLFKLKSCGRLLIIILSWLHLFHLLIYFSVEGLIWNEIYFLILIPITLFILIFFNSKYMNLLIPYKKSIKIISLILGIIFIILVIIYSIIIVRVNNSSADLLSIEFQPSKFKDFEEVVRFDFANLYSIDLPINKVQLVSKATNLDGQNIGFADVDDSLAIIISHSPKDDVINEEKLKKLNKSDLNISRKIMKEKFGFKYLVISGKIDFLFKVDYLEFANNDLIFEYKNDWKYNNYTFYKQEENIGAINFVNLKSGNKSNKLTVETSFVKKLLSSIKPINIKIKTSENYYQEGIILYKKNQFERAFLKFYSSLSIDSENIECKLYLLKSFISTKNFTYPSENSKWYRTKVSLEKMFKDNPDNKNVKDFYEFVKSEVDKYEKRSYR